MNLLNIESVLFAAGKSGVLLLPIMGCLAVGLCVFVAARTFANELSTKDLDQDDNWRYDVNRINELRRVSPLYRMFQPLIQAFAQMNRRMFHEQLPEINRQIHAAGLPRFWTAAEYLGRMELIALLLTPAYLYVTIELMGPSGTATSVVLMIVTVVFQRRRLALRARYRLMLIKRRLPFLLDLLTLLMEAGSTFWQSLEEAVDEFRHHPVGVEFGRVLGEMSMGKTRTEALTSLDERLNDDEITSIVGSIVQGEELGTPLALLFRTQADVLRIKRTQRAETVAGEAGVKMLLPAVLIMAATVLIILGPFVLNFIYTDILS